MGIQAIQTHYAGYRFRSRLEARWAVFFDHLDMEWEYEVEGYQVDTPAGKIKYLPDFWLPQVLQFIEVKGHLELSDLRRLYAIAYGMTGCGKGNDIAVLGNVPRSGSVRWPIQLHRHAGKLWALPWVPSADCPLNGRPKQHVDPRDERWCSLLIEGVPVGQPDWAEEALDAARQARFEHGENG
jgi:hypothetical protein